MPRPDQALHPTWDSPLARRRFEGVERLAREQHIDLASSDLSTLDALWDRIKHPPETS